MGKAVKNKSNIKKRTNRLLSNLNKRIKSFFRPIHISGANKKALSGEEYEKNKKRTLKKRSIKTRIVSAGLFVLAFVVVVYAGFYVYDNVKHRQMISSAGATVYAGVDEPQSHVRAIEMNEAQQKDKIKETKRSGDTLSFDFFVNSDIVFDELTPLAALNFGNPKSNDCVLIATLLDENASVLYRSAGLHPGQEIVTFKLARSIPYGETTGYFVVSAFDNQNQKHIGTQTVRVKINLK